MQLATKKPVLTLGLIFCTIGILWSVNIGGPEVVLQQPKPVTSNVQLLPVQDVVTWYSPLLPRPAVQASDSVQSQSPAIETYLIQGSLLLSLIVVVLSTLLVGRRRHSSEHIAEVQVKLPEVEAARILEMDHERARLAIAKLSGAFRMEVLQSIVELGDTPEDLPVVQVPSQEQLELTSCG
jgi:hypothetical protein